MLFKSYKNEKGLKVIFFVIFSYIKYKLIIYHLPIRLPYPHLLLCKCSRVVKGGVTNSFLFYINYILYSFTYFKLYICTNLTEIKLLSMAIEMALKQR